MARTKHETDELLLGFMDWSEADPGAALFAATVNDGTDETGAVITLGHAGCTVSSIMAIVAELLDVAEEMILAGTGLCDTPHSLERIRASRTALGMRNAELVQ